MVLLGDGLLTPCEKEEIVDFTSLFRAVWRWRKLFITGLALFLVGGGLFIWLRPEQFAAETLMQIGSFGKGKKGGGWIIQKGLSVPNFKDTEAMLHDLNAVSVRMANEAAFTREERESFLSDVREDSFKKYFIPHTNFSRLVEIDEKPKATVLGFQLKSVADTPQTALRFLQFWADFLRSRYLFFAIKDYALLGHNHLSGGKKDRIQVVRSFFDQLQERMAQAEGDGIVLYSALKEIHGQRFGGDVDLSAAERLVGDAMSMDLSHFQDLYYGVFDYLSTPIARSLNPPGVRGLQMVCLVGLSLLFWLLAVVVVDWARRNASRIRMSQSGA